MSASDDLLNGIKRRIDSAIGAGGAGVSFAAGDRWYINALEGMKRFVIEWEKRNAAELSTRPATPQSTDEREQNARRYEWLRDYAKGTAASAEFWPAVRLELPRELDRYWSNELDCEDLDAAIDAAMLSAATETKEK